MDKTFDRILTYRDCRELAYSYFFWRLQLDFVDISEVESMISGKAKEFGLNCCPTNCRDR